MEILTIFNIVSVAIRCQEQEQYHEVNLINRLNAFFGFDYNIFFVDTSTNFNRYIPINDNNVMNFTPQTIFTFDQDIIYNNETQLALQSVTRKNTFLILVVGDGVNIENHTQLTAEIKAIRRFDNNLKVAIFFARNITSMDSIEQLFRWSWNNGIVNIFCAFYYNAEDTASSLNVLRFDPFPTLKLINVTETESLQNYFPRKVPNYHKQPLRFLRVLEWNLQNLEIEFWTTVVGAFNATKTMDTFNISVALTHAHPQTDYVFIQEALHGVNNRIYPHRMKTVVLLVPHALPYSNFSAYLQNSAFNILLAYTFGVIVAASLPLIVSGYWKTKKFLFFQCVADVTNLLLNDNCRIRYSQLHYANVWVVVPLTFAGLIMVNGVL